MSQSSESVVSSKAGRPHSSNELRRKFWIKVSLVVVILVALFWDGYHRRPTAAAEGISFFGNVPDPVSAGTAKPFRVGIFNIAGGYGIDHRRDLDRTAKTLEGCDFIGLNEVHAGFPWQKQNQALLLGAKLNLSWLFAPTERRWWQDDFGNGVLSKIPVAHWQRFPISTRAAKSNRNVVLVRAQYQNRTLNILITHLDRHEDHDGELRAVAELFLSLAEPAILMGDLNDSASHPEIRRLQTTPGVTDVTGLAPTKHRDSDWIFSRGLTCARADLKEEGASDHPFYWADFELIP